VRICIIYATRLEITFGYGTLHPMPGPLMSLA
jgi:hypothetical protein